MSQTHTALLRRIAADHGGILRPADVVEEARAVTSPLHQSFEWNDTKAATQYRLQQAEQIIRLSVIVVGNDEPVYTRCFVSLTSERGTETGGYREVLSVLSDAETRSQLLQDALREMNAFRIKYQGLRELDRIFQAMRLDPT